MRQNYIVFFGILCLMPLISTCSALVVYPTYNQVVWRQEPTRVCNSTTPLIPGYNVDGADDTNCVTGGGGNCFTTASYSNVSRVYLHFENVPISADLVLRCGVPGSHSSPGWTPQMYWTTPYRLTGASALTTDGFSWNTQPVNCDENPAGDGSVLGYCYGSGVTAPSQNVQSMFSLTNPEGFQWNLSKGGLYNGYSEGITDIDILLTQINSSVGTNYPCFNKAPPASGDRVCALTASGFFYSNVVVTARVNGLPTGGVIIYFYDFFNELFIVGGVSNASGIAGFTLPYSTYDLGVVYVNPSDSSVNIGEESFIIDSTSESVNININCPTCAGTLLSAELYGVVYYNGVPQANATVTLINGSDAERHGYTNASGYYSIPNLRTCEYNGFASYNGVDSEPEGVSLMGEIVNGVIQHDFYIEDIGVDSVLNISVFDSTTLAGISGVLVYDYWCPTMLDLMEYYGAHGLEGCILNHFGLTNTSGKIIFPSHFYNIWGDGVAYTLLILKKSGYENLVFPIEVAPSHTDLAYYMTGPGGGVAGFNITYNITGFYGEAVSGALVSTDAYVSGMHPHVEGVTAASGLVTLSYSTKPTALSGSVSKLNYDTQYFTSSVVKNWYNIRLYPSQGEYNDTDTFEIGGYVQLGVNPLSGVSVVAQCDLYFGASQNYESETHDDGFYSFTIPEAMCLIYPASTVSYDFTPSEYADFDTALGDNETLNFTASINPNQRYAVVAHAYTRSGAIFTSPLEGVEVYVQCLNDTSIRPESGTTNQNGEAAFNLYSGEYNFTFTKSGFLVINNYYTVTRTQTGPVEVEMRTGADKGSASVTLFRKVGDVSESESGVFALKDSNGDIVWTTTTPTHTYLFSNLAPGRYSVGAIGTRGGTAAVSFNVEAGKTTVVTMTIDDLIARLNDAWESFLNVVILLMGGMGFILLLVFFAVISVLIGVITRGK